MELTHNNIHDSDWCMSNISYLYIGNYHECICSSKCILSAESYINENVCKYFGMREREANIEFWISKKPKQFPHAKPYISIIRNDDNTFYVFIRIIICISGFGWHSKKVLEYTEKLTKNTHVNMIKSRIKSI